MKTWLATALLLFVAAPIHAQTTKRFAIVVGHNQPDDNTLPVLRYADDDAIATHRLLTEAGVSSQLLVVPDRDTLQLHSIRAQPPTWKNLQWTVQHTNKEITKARKQGLRTELLFFYSGHGGVANGQGYVLLANERLYRERLYQQVLKTSRAHRNHVIVDACKSYFLAFSKGPGGKRRTFGRSFAQQALPSKLKNTGFILSTSSDRDSHEWERFQAGVFSYEVRSGLRGAADANADGNVTYAELGAFLKTANKNIPNAQFRPQFTVRPPGKTSNLSQSILRWTNKDNTLHVDTTLGHIYVETALGERIMDAHPADGTTLVLHIPESRPQFVRTRDASSEFVIREQQDLHLSQLPQIPVRLARKGALHLAFEKLFVVPFSKHDVSSYRKNYRWDLALARVPPPSTREKVQYVAGWSTIGASALGLSATLLAFQRQNKGKDVSDAELRDINSQIRKLNRASYIFYGIAGASAATWLAAKYWPRKKTPKLIFSPTKTGGAMLYRTQW